MGHENGMERGQWGGELVCVVKRVRGWLVARASSPVPLPSLPPPPTPTRPTHPLPPPTPHPTPPRRQFSRVPTYSPSLAVMVPASFKQADGWFWTKPYDLR